MSAAALASTPALDALLLAMRGREREGDHRGALRLYEAAAPALREEPLSLYAQGSLLYRLGRLDEAERAFRAALAVAPGTADLLVNLALTLLTEAKSQIDEARRAKVAEARAILDALTTSSDERLPVLADAIAQLRATATRLS